MTDTYEFTEYKRQDLVYNFTTMTSQEITEVKARAAEAEKEAAAKKAAAAAAPKPAPTTEAKTDSTKS